MNQAHLKSEMMCACVCVVKIIVYAEKINVMLAIL
jgi:hypothetical protein